MRPIQSLFVALATWQVAVACTGSTRATAPATGPDLASDAVLQARAAPGDERLLIRTASMTIEVERVADAETGIVALTQRVGGFVENSSRDDDDRARFTLRVPSTSLDGTLDSLGRLGRVRDRAVRASDVTADARDLDARIANLRATRDRLRQLVERAADVGDIAAVERELGRVQGELDTLEARQKGLRSDVALARVTVDVRRRRVLGPLGLALAGAAWVVEKLFVWR